MLSSSTHLMTNFLEFDVQWGVTLTGIEPISIVVLKRFLLWCFFLHFDKDAAWFHWFTLFRTSICHAIHWLSQCKYIQIQWNIFVCCLHDEESWPLIVIFICLTWFMIDFICLGCGVWGRAWGWLIILSVHAHNGLVGFRSLPPRLNT